MGFRIQGTWANPTSGQLLNPTLVKPKVLSAKFYSSQSTRAMSCFSTLIDENWVVFWRFQIIIDKHRVLSSGTPHHWVALGWSGPGEGGGPEGSEPRRKGAPNPAKVEARKGGARRS